MLFLQSIYSTHSGTLLKGYLMVRDIEIMKEILLKLEEKQSIVAEEIKLDGYDNAAVVFNCILLNEAGFIKGIIQEERGGGNLPLAYPTRITWKGYANGKFPPPRSS